ncbi:interferon-inducible GTPase 5-like [Tiliqua scincoides]|uniref:interferon-inducible GTPase 5-like n=1 Tax=Tiliqua scincoides TaxID=71010 RepID=UPI003462FD78
MESQMASKQPDDAELGQSCSKRPQLDPKASQPPATTSHHAAEKLDSLTEEDIKDFKDALEGGRMAEAVSKIMENLKALDKVCLDIAVTGECGSGKSTFVNAIRGLGDEDDGAAPTGVVETTTLPTPYAHPKHPNVTVWDLPGIGTPNFQPSFYLEQVKLSRYDFFILLASERFRSNHAQLARKIQKMGKHFYFVRSKVDVDLEAAKKRRPRAYNKETVLKQIRDNCQQCLQDEGIDSPKVFLLSSWKLNKYDFKELEETMEKELPRHKRHAFLLALPNISLEVLQKKKEAFQKQIWKWAIISCGVAAVRIPGLSVACDVTILMKSLSKYRQNFGLDDESLKKLAEQVAKPVEDIKAVIKSPLAKEISRDVVLKLLTNAGGGALMVAEWLTSTVPIFGSMLAGSISFGTTYYMLQNSLNEVAEDAQHVLFKAFESHA